jgi:hypothetical protein
MPVFDATALLYFLEHEAKAPLDPATDTPVTDAKARIDFLITTLENRRETIVIPTPALSEVLVHAGEAGPEYLEILKRLIPLAPGAHDVACLPTAGRPG